MKRITFIKILLLAFYISNGQAPSIMWEKSLGGTGEDAAYSIQNTPDNGYIVVGASNSTDVNVTGNHGGFDFWVVKIDSIGNIQWQKSYGGSNRDIAKSVALTSDGGYIVAGETNSIDGDVTNNPGLFNASHCWVIKISSTGALLWQKFFQFGLTASTASCIIQSGDGNYVFAGTGWYLRTVGNSYMDGIVAKISSDGNIIWTDTLGGYYHDELVSIVRRSDGGYAVCGYSASSDGFFSQNKGVTDFYIAGISNIGVTQWEKLYGGTQADYANSIIQNNNGDFIITGQSNSSDGDFPLNKGATDLVSLKLNNLGNIVWQKTYGGTNNDVGKFVIQDTDSSFVITGSSNSTDGDITNYINLLDYWVLRLSIQNGNILWQKKYGGGNRDESNAIKLNPDGSLIVAGYATYNGGDVTNSNGYVDYWIVKLIDNSYVFTGNGNWNIPSNWLNNKMPPTSLTGNAQVIIDPVPQGECILNISQYFGNQVKLTVKDNKKFRIQGNLQIQN